MTSSRTLSDAFEAAQGDGAADREGNRRDREGTVELEVALARAVERGRAAWPDLDVPDERFAAYVGARVGPSELESARIEDLWAACACEGSDRARAIAAVEARYFPDVEGSLRKMRLEASRIDELKQILRHVLFVGSPEDGVAPRIGDYRGTGDLRAWLRVTATRAALKLARKESREVEADDALLQASTSADDPELSYMKSAYRETFKAAFQEALDSLAARQRLLLKQQVVDGLNIDEVGALYQVHRATAARWLEGARDELLERTRKIFMQRARISNDECASILRLVRSQLDLSIHRRLSSGSS